MIQKGPSLHGSERLVAKKSTVSKKTVLVYIQALLEPYEKICGLRKDQQNLGLIGISLFSLSLTSFMKFCPAFSGITNSPSQDVCASQFFLDN